MLQQKAVETSTLELVKSLQQKDYLKGFYLVGGTALAIVHGYRKSDDIDLFTNADFDTAILVEQIHHDYPFQLFHTAPNIVKGYINSTNVDLIAHRYPLLKQPVEIEGVWMLSEEDILAMKLNAIATSGQRSKDFIDIYFALRHFSIEDMVRFYKEKYSQKSEMHVVKSLIYFDDVDLSDWPFLLLEPKLKWSQVKKKLEEEVENYVKRIL